MRISLILACGGSGKRFQSGLARRGRGAAAENSPAAKLPSKLFYPLAGKPLLARTLSAFRNIPQINEILIPLPAGAASRVHPLMRSLNLAPVKLVRGGKTRAQSVWRALRHAHPKSDWILVHDGARPLISPEAIRKVLRHARGSDAVLLAKKVVSTVKEVDSRGNVVGTVDRSRLCEAETPQFVRRRVLEKAYRENPRAWEATDEAALVESSGGRVRTLLHEEWNPKVTTVKDLELIESILASNTGPGVRTGFGRDTHRLVGGRPLYLGGLRIPSDKGALGHSDGDALLHAVADALLGAAGLGDIGDRYSDRNPRFKNIRSEKMLAAILNEAAQKGWSPVHIDTVIVLERPRLGAAKKKMEAKMAKILKLSPQDVSVKAKTAEGLGPEGQGLAVTCEAVVTVKRRRDF